MAWSFVAGLTFLVVEIQDLPSAAVSFLSSLYLLALLAAVCAIDSRYGIIPDSLVVALAVGGLAQSAYTDPSQIWQRSVEGLAMLLAAWMFRAAYRWARGFDGLGFGDVKFAAAAVLWIGIAAFPGLLLIAVVSAFASLLVLKAGGVALDRSTSLPFGPHLAIGLWLSWIAAVLSQAF